MLLFTHLNICSRASTTCFSNDCILNTPIKHPSKFSSKNVGPPVHFQNLGAANYILGTTTLKIGRALRVCDTQ